MKKNFFIFHLLKTLSPVILVTLVGITNEGFVTRAIEGNTFLNSAIIGVASFGAFLMLMRLIEANRERTALQRFAREVEGGANMKELMAEPWLSRRTVQRYLDNIAQTGGKLASQLDQNAIERELDGLRSDFDSRMELPSFLVGFMIAMGLLGTFIGLLETLTGISSMLDGMVNTPADETVEAEFLKLVGQLRHPLAGMGIAFSASMFGLISSLMLGIMQTAVRRFNKIVLAEASELVHRLTERVRGPVVGAATITGRGGVSEAFLSDFMAELIQNMNQMMEMFHRSQDVSLAMSSRVDNLSRRLETMSAAIESNVEAAKRTNDLLGFGPRMKETNEEMLSELRTIVASGVEQQKSASRLTDSLVSIEQKLGASYDSARGHYDLLGNLTTQSVAKLDETVSVLQAVSDLVADGDAKQDRKLQALTASSSNMNASLQQLTIKLNDIANVGQNQLNTTGTQQLLLRDASTEVQGLLKDVQAKLQKLQEVEIGATRHLYGIKEAFDSMAQSFDVMKVLPQGIEKQTTLLEASLEEMRMSHRTLAREIRAEFREAARESMRQQPATAQPN